MFMEQVPTVALKAVLQSFPLIRNKQEKEFGSHGQGSQKDSHLGKG